jgi:hypothetical protein
LNKNGPGHIFLNNLPKDLRLGFDSSLIKKNPGLVYTRSEQAKLDRMK